MAAGMVVLFDDKRERNHSAVCYDNDCAVSERDLAGNIFDALGGAEETVQAISGHIGFLFSVIQSHICIVNPPPS